VEDMKSAWDGKDVGGFLVEVQKAVEATVNYAEHQAQVEELKATIEEQRAVIDKQRAEIEAQAAEIAALSNDQEQLKAENARLEIEVSSAVAVASPGSPVAAAYKHSRAMMKKADVPETVGTTQGLKLSGYHSWTFECWVNVECANDREEHGILSAVVKEAGKWTMKEHGDLLHCILKPRASGEPLRAFMSFTHTGDTMGGTALSPGTWYHVAFAYDADASEHRIYVDGMLDGSGESKPLQGNFEVNIGHFKPRAMLTGRMAEARLWGCARTEDEISTNMNAVLKGTEEQCQGKLTAMWKLSDGDIKSWP